MNQTYEEKLMDKYEKMFSKSYSNKTKFAVDKVEDMMHLDKYVTIPMKNIAFEIIMKNKTNPNFI